MKKMATKAKIERFDCEISFKCPECGTEWFCGIELDDVYDLVNGFFRTECGKCGTKLEIVA